MRPTAKFVSTTASVIAILGSLALTLPAKSLADEATIKEGKEVAFDRKKGNCLSCHKMAGGSLEGNIGPELVAMQARFPDKSKLRDQIYDPRTSNPATIMPPFGKHEILTATEVDKVVEFIHSL
ncbi:MAG: L-cysteine S-thiosulfotransferase [Pseudomonadota bacterium]|nr:L-cysteine S-thiosulfotransferase [Pseudomonadota bacterium]